MTFHPPTIEDLMIRYLDQVEDAQLAVDSMVATDEVEPHNTTIAFRADPRLAWTETLEILGHFGVTSKDRVKMPTEWASAMNGQDSLCAVPMAIGCFPQQVRDVTVLLNTDDLRNQRPQNTDGATASSALKKWAEKLLTTNELVSMLVAVGVLRTAKVSRMDVLESLSATAAEKDLVQNEYAASLWLQGQYEEARKIWSALPESIPVLFNLGMSALFAEEPKLARDYLNRVISQLPESSSWHHLASLYLAVSEIKG